MLMSEILIKNMNGMKKELYSSQMISDEVSRGMTNRKNNILSVLSEVTSGISNIKEILDPDKIYIARFPKDVMEKMNEGQFDIMKSKSGDLLSTIIDKTKPANKNIVHQLRLDQMDPAFAEKMRSLSSNVTNIAIQKQLADVTEMLSEIHSLSKDIKRGQVIDRIGLVMSGKSQFEQALEISSGNPQREQLMLNAVSSLNDGRSQLEMYFKEEAKNIPRIPNNKFLLTMKCLFDTKFYNKVENFYNELQESFEAYVYATNLLAAAYENIGRAEVLPKVYEPTRILIKDYSDKMIPLSQMVVAGNVEAKTCWYNNPSEYIEAIEVYTKRALLDEVECISIEFVGSELLEGNVK